MAYGLWKTPVRIKNRTRRDGDCVVWTGKRFRDGDQSGRVRVSRIAIPVHRAVYSWEFGVVPEGMDVRQQCGNPLCVHRGHLMLSPTD
jgi:hypothetical protein